MRKKFLWFSIVAISMFIFIVFTMAGCKEESVKTEEATEETVEEATEETVEEATEETYEMVIITKMQHPWFDEMEKGMDEAGDEIGNIDVSMINPAEFDASQQVALVEDCIAKGVDVISVIPADPDALEPVFEKAMSKGIITLTHESTVQENVTYDIEAFDNVSYGEFIMDALAEYMDYEGKYVILVGSLTGVSHNEWADAEVARAEEMYSDMEQACERVETGEKEMAGYEKTLELIKAYPDLKGIITASSADTPGCALAIEEKGLVDQISIVGGGVPSQVREYLKNGSIRACANWSPRDLGYVQVWVANEILNGREIDDGMEIPRLGEIKLVDKVIYGSAILKIDKDNVDDFDY